MNHADPNAYLRTKVLTASPAELRLLLLDGAVKFLRQGRDAIARKDHEGTFHGVSKCRNIVLELMNTIKPEPDRELYTRVTALYTFMYTELVEISMSRDLVRCDKVIELLEYERETWVMLMDKLAQEKQSLTASENRQAAAAGVTEPMLVNASPAGHRSLSLQG
jgi:flagellar secretion chaperone FliS